MKAYAKEIILGIFVLAIIGLSIVQYQYAQIGLYVAQVGFQKHLSNAFSRIENDLSVEHELSFLMREALAEEQIYFQLPADSLRTLASGFLHDFLTDRFLGAGIQAKFGYSLNLGDSSVAALRYFPYEEAEQAQTHTLLIGGYFQNTLGTPLRLQVYFHDMDSYLRQKLNGIIIPSILFLVLIIGITIWVFWQTYYQRRVITTTNTFINNLTHELKTPVFSIGLATKLLEAQTGLKDHPALTHIKLQNDRLKSHIEKVLALAEIEEKGHAMQLERLNLAPMLTSLDQEYTLKAQVEGFEFSAEYPEVVWVQADAANFRNALVNLLENAIKYGGEAGPVTLMVQEDGRRYRFVVSDQGPGIPAKRQRDIFKKFYRISEGDEHRHKGYGLGLHYVRQVVKFHRGKLILDSAPGAGTRMQIYLSQAKAIS